MSCSPKLAQQSLTSILSLCERRGGRRTRIHRKMPATVISPLLLERGEDEGEESKSEAQSLNYATSCAAICCSLVWRVSEAATKENATLRRTCSARRENSPLRWVAHARAIHEHRRGTSSRAKQCRHLRHFAHGTIDRRRSRARANGSTPC